VSSLGVLRARRGDHGRQLYEALLKLAVPTGHPVVHAARSVGAGPTERYKLIGCVSRRRRPLRLIDDPATGELQLYYGAADSCGADLLQTLTTPSPLVQGEGITTFGVNEVARAGAGNPRRKTTGNGRSRQ